MRKREEKQAIQKKTGEKSREVSYWIYRYLRLHSELLKDSVYRELYDTVRQKRIVRHKNIFHRKDEEEKAIGEVLDMGADFLNKESPNEVEEWRGFVTLFYEAFKSGSKKKEEL